MKEDVLKILKCPDCGSRPLELIHGALNQLEVESGRLLCHGCTTEYKIEEGVIDFLHNANESVLRERKAMDSDDYIRDEYGKKHRITGESIQQFKHKFFSLPEGDGSHFFKNGGSFQTIAEASDRFYSTLNGLSLTGKEKVLEIGACFSYASFKFAQKGCDVVATDISNYLKVANLFVKKAYFERMFSDMHNIPFVDNAFDIVFGAAVLHHSKDLKKVFKEIHRVLKPGGRLVLINETSRGLLERVHPVYKEMEEKGFGDTAYTLIEWKKSARAGGFRRVKIELLSLADDYVTRRKNRGAKLNFKLRLAYFFKKHRRLERIVSLITIIPRFVFRPKSWRLICYK